MPNKIEDGMSFEELLASGEDNPEMFASLVVDLIDQIEFATTPGVDSDINRLVEQLLQSTNEEEQKLIVNAICDILQNFTTTIDDQIQKDLAAQEELRTRLSSLNVAAALLPPEIPQLVDNTLFQTIATPKFKDIIEENI